MVVTGYFGLGWMTALGKRNLLESFKRWRRGRGRAGTVLQARDRSRASRRRHGRPVGHPPGLAPARVLQAVSARRPARVLHPPRQGSRAGGRPDGEPEHLVGGRRVIPVRGRGSPRHGGEPAAWRSSPPWARSPRRSRSTQRPASPSSKPDPTPTATSKRRCASS